VNTDEHPNVIALKARVARLEELVASSSTDDPSSKRQFLIESERRQLGLLRDQLAQTKEDIAGQTELIDKTPAVGEDLAALEQRLQVLQSDYLASLRKVEEAKLAENLERAQQGSQVTVLDAAQPPTSPERPRSIVLAGGVGATLAAAFGLAILLELVDPVVLAARQLESIADRPALGAIPRIV